MSIRFKVLSGTRSAGASRLCDTCESGVVRRGASANSEEIHCMLTRQQVLIPVIDCNRYVNRERVYDDDEEMLPFPID